MALEPELVFVKDTEVTLAPQITDCEGVNEAVTFTQVSQLVGCSPLTISTTNTSTGGNLSYQWFIDGVLTSTSTTINPVLTAPAGNVLQIHTIRLLTSNQCGVSDTTVSITVHPKVVTVISPVFSIICAANNFTYTFTQQSQGDSLTYFWNFDNGNTSTSSNPSAQPYPGPQSYSPYVVATGFCGTDTAFASLSVYPVPDPPIVPGVTICSGNTATLIATITIGTCQWYTVASGGILLSTGTSYTTPVLSATTTYYVQTIYNGCVSARIPVTVTVTPLPVAPTVALATICQGTTATLTATAPPVATYNWFTVSSGGVSIYNGSSFTTPVLSVTTTYYVDATVNSCFGPRKDVIVTVNPIPATPTAPPVSICTGTSATVIATAPGGTYEWYNASTGGILLSTGASYTTSPLTTPITYFVQTTVNGCISPRTAVNVTINPFPIADFYPDINTGCVGLIVNFTNNSTAGGAYIWNFSGANPSTSTLYTPPPVIFNTAGTRMVYINVNVAGCITYDTIYISIDPRPLPSFTLTNTTSCSPATTAINNTSLITAGDTYLWNFDNGTTSSLQNPPSQTYTTTGVDSIYKIKLIIFGINGCKDSVIHTITVHPNPVPSFATTDTVCLNTNLVFLNNSMFATTYTWSFGDGSTSILTNPNHTYSSPNTYTTQLISSTSFGCKDSIQKIIFVASNPVSAYSATTACHTYPTLFNDSSISAISWSWNYGDATVLDTNQSPTHTYLYPGNYNVSLGVSNIFGCSVSSTQLITVLPQPIANFISGLVCAKQNVNFTDATIGVSMTNWTWDFGDGTPVNNLQNSLHLYPLGGIYNVTLIAENTSGCKDTTVKLITVNTVPSPLFTANTVCLGAVTSFINQSTDTVAINQWFYDFGDGNNSTSQNPNYLYTTPATYNVKLTVTNINGCDSSIIKPVTVNIVPKAIYNVDTVCLGISTLFTDVSTGNPTQWTWDFADGSAIDVAQNTTHLYTTPGTYPVTLLIQNVFGCKDSVVKYAIVYPLPFASFTFDTVCANLPTSYIDQSTSVVSWMWDFGDGSPVNTGNSPTHIYSSSGMYNVKLIVRNINGCADTVSHSILVNPNPVSAFAVTTACYSYPTLFTNNSTGTISQAWNFGDATAIDSSQSPAHLYANPANYNVSLLVKNIFGCTNSSSYTLTVLPKPNAAFTYSSIICAQQIMQFTDQTIGTSVNNWYWDFGDGSPIGNAQNPTHIYSLIGNYTIKLIAENTAGCSDTIIKQIIVYTVPTPLFTATVNCQGAVTNFTDYSTDLVAFNNWYWDFNDGNNSVAQNPNYIYGAPATYNVSLTVTNINGCQNMFTLPITVNVIPAGAYTVDSICLGSPTTFTDISTGNPTRWLWSFGDGDTDTIGPVTNHIYTTAGSFLSSLTVSNGSCTNQVFRIVVVHNDIQAGIAANNSICLNGLLTINDNSVITAGNIISNTWDFGDGSPLNYSLNTTHSYTTAGSYTITHVIVSDRGCVNTALDTVVVNPSPIAAFSVNPTCQNQPSLFIDSTTGSPVTWNWVFGDLGTSTLQNPIHQYSQNGNYAVVLIVASSGGCADTTQRNVYVYSQPQASFTSSLVCWGDTTTFTNTSSIIDGTITNTWWDFGDGTTSTSLSPNHSFLMQNDTFNVTMSILTSHGCIDTIVKQVVTYPFPVFNFAPNLTSGCDIFTTTFRDSSTVSGGSVVNWIWNFGDGNYGYVQNPTYNYVLPGNYYVSLTVTSSAGCKTSDTLSYPVVVYPTPVADFVATPPETSLYQPDIQFTDESTGANYWTWSFGDYNSSSLPNPYHTYTDTGTFIITQIVSNQFGCSDTVQQLIRINPEYALFIPNAFTPNSNGLNDIFLPRANGAREFRMLIFDRWGDEIFQSDDANIGWDGHANGGAEIVPIGAYIYRITTKDLGNNKHTYVGKVIVVR